MKTETRRLGPNQKKSFLFYLRRDWVLLAILALPVVYMLVFKYLPMAGLLMAFQKVPRRGSFWGIFTSNQWVGFQNFIDFFNTPLFWKLMRNTFLLSLYGLIWSFPVPILFAVMLNELRRKYQRVMQTLAYIPYFISLVVAMAIVGNLLSPNGGLFNQVRELFGLESLNFLAMPKYFRTIFISSGVWQSFGYNAIIYLAAITSIDQELYEAATIDGATRFQQMRRITLPQMMPTIIIMLILALGNLLNVGFEKVLLLYQPATYEVSDVLSTFVYRIGLGSSNPNYGLGTAAGLFNSVINFVLVLAFNKFARKVSDTSLW